MNMKSSAHILIVDDDHDIRDLLSQLLQRHDYRTSVARDGVEMMAVIAETSVDLIVLDIMLPGKDGMTLCREMRAQSTVPIIMLTAVTEEVERILGLELGADDYLSKPFNPRELVARIKAVLRRVGMQGVPEEVELVAATERALKHYRFSAWQLDGATRQLVSPEGLEVSVTTGEYDLLLAFLQHPQQVLSRDRLLDLTKNRSAGPFDRSIDIQVSRLRNKIEVESKSPQIIKTVRGGGYVLSVSVEIG